MSYDSSKDTLEHKKRVCHFINIIISELLKREEWHDESKLKSPEKEIFDEYTPKLKNSTYGSEEYKTFLKEMTSALEHHYSINSHHPEHYFNGINEMDLIDIIEMFCDWKAASERHTDGDILKSIDINKNRFELDEQLAKIFKNTVKRYL